MVPLHSQQEERCQKRANQDYLELLSRVPCNELLLEFYNKERKGKREERRGKDGEEKWQRETMRKREKEEE